MLLRLDKVQRAKHEIAVKRERARQSHQAPHLKEVPTGTFFYWDLNQFVSAKQTGSSLHCSNLLRNLNLLFYWVLMFSLVRSKINVGWAFSSTILNHSGWK